MSKGEETKNRILFVARDLFYEYGFHKTTARMISEKANTNLGLLNYYFKNKNEMGLIIYSSIRDRFDELIAEYFPDMATETERSLDVFGRYAIWSVIVAFSQ